ncbi:MAG: acyl-CoA dehydrogenase [Gammaproteobacteria bacterium]|nr:acyl-CoA dehydrogenase [Gammaproteobacteria bacterium]
MFELTEEQRMLRDLVAKFVDQKLMPLEPQVLAREARGGEVGLTEEESAPLLAQCRELGLWGLDVPESYGGANLPNVALMAVNEELGRTCVPFTFPPDSPNLHMLMAVADDEQKENYLKPYAAGTAHSAIAISEPGAGADPAGMITRATQDGADWVINGRKIWISRIAKADFTIVMARTGEGSRQAGITAFIVERDTPGLIIEREIRMLGGQRTYEVVFDNCRVPARQILGQLGQGFAPMQLRLTIRRLQMGAWCTGMTVRALALLTEQARSRTTFGARLADRQAIQWWVADIATQLHACRLMVLDAAAKQDAGRDVRTEASMIKVFATEMASAAIDHAMQAYGAMGMTKEMPLQLMATQVRTMRIYEGPSEVHRMSIARRILEARH